MAELYELDTQRKPRGAAPATTTTAKTRPRLTVETLDDNGEPLARHKLVGRFAWCLHELLQAGERGCTPIDRPGPRWSHYVHVLRRDGFQIETYSEHHGGPFSGTHGRYILRSKVRVLQNAFTETGSAA